MLVTRLGLVDKTGAESPHALARVAAAISTQFMRDVGPAWNVSATCEALPDDAAVPPGVQPIYLVAHLEPGEGGFHSSAQGRPFANVVRGTGWTVAASHEAIEMVLDPWGSRLVTAPVITVDASGNQGLGTEEVGFLLEGCDPCESASYSVNKVPVSDFLLPDFYTPSGQFSCSFLGTIKQPLTIAEGGYISWLDNQSDSMMQLLWLDPSKPPQLVNLGSVSGARSLREFSDAHVRQIVGRAAGHEA